MKSNIQKVYSKLPNQELSAHNVELALDGDLKEQGQKAQSIFNDGRKNANNVIMKAVSELENAKKSLNTLSKQIDTTYSKALKSAKEIGVDLDGTTVGKNYKKAFSDVEDYLISTTSAISKLSKFKI
tara:strand:+ start:44 stop:424 length:381 start_codon:yes stop_codon:yes gene_type:complete